MSKTNILTQKLKTAGLVAVSLLASGAAWAEGEASAAMAAISTEATSLITDAWPIVTALTVAFVGMKLFKKSANKAT